MLSSGIKHLVPVMPALGNKPRDTKSPFILKIMVKNVQVSPNKIVLSTVLSSGIKHLVPVMTVLESKPRGTKSPYIPKIMAKNVLIPKKEIALLIVMVSGLSGAHVMLTQGQRLGVLLLQGCQQMVVTNAHYQKRESVL